MLRFCTKNTGKLVFSNSIIRMSASHNQIQKRLYHNKSLIEKRNMSTNAS